MLLLAIDENHSGTYDFLYLPIDFKVSFTFDAINHVHSWIQLMTNRCYLLWLQNKCNVGYAFINMISPSHIISFYQVEFSILRSVVAWLFVINTFFYLLKRDFKLMSYVYQVTCTSFVSCDLSLYYSENLMVTKPANYNC